MNLISRQEHVVPSSPGRPTSLSIPQLRAAVSGRVIAPDDADYDAARTVFIGGIDRRPAVIVRVADAADVAHVISVARETGLPLAVRSGGHGNVGQGVCEGGIVLDLRDLRELEIDVAGRTAWAGAGPDRPPSTRTRSAPTGWPPASATRDRSAWAGSRSAAASATSCASTA